MAWTKIIPSQIEEKILFILVLDLGFTQLHGTYLEHFKMDANTLIKLFEKRTSCRSYENRPVPRAMLEQLIEAARLAPSACNKQPWRFAVVTAPQTRQELISKAFLKGIPMPWAKNAAALIALGIEKTTLTHRIAPKISGVEYPLLDAGIAGEHLILQAEALGLGSCWIGWIKPKAVQKIVQWPKKITPVALISVGWPVSNDWNSRPRKSAHEIAKWIET